MCSISFTIPHIVSVLLVPYDPESQYLESTTYGKSNDFDKSDLNFSGTRIMWWLLLSDHLPASARLVCLWSH